MQIQTLLSNRANYGNKRATSTVKFLVLHYTANDGDRASSNAKYFHNNVVKASAHYFVDDTEIWQSVPDDYVAWAVGGSKYKNTVGGTLHGVATNANTLSIEMCDTVKNGKIEPTEATIRNAVNLTRTLMAKYNVPISRVIRHFDVTGKPCPAYWVSGSRWQNEFISRLKSQPAAQKVPDVFPGTTAVANPKYKVIVNSLNVRKGPGTGYAIVREVKKNEVYTITEVNESWGRLLSGIGWINISDKYCKKV